MATFTMPLPAPGFGSTERRVAELESYLNQLVDTLTFTLSSLDEENMSEAFNKQIVRRQQDG